MSEIKIGDHVRVKEDRIDGFIVSQQRKLQNRVGIVIKLQYLSNKYIIQFDKRGNRKAYTWVPPSNNYVEKV